MFLKTPENVIFFVVACYREQRTIQERGQERYVHFNQVILYFELGQKTLSIVQRDW